MTGLSKITDKIIVEAQRDARATVTEAETKAKEIRAEYAARAEELRRRVDEEARKSAEEIVSRAKADEAMIRRSAALTAKGDMVDEVFALAKQEILSLPEEQYLDFLTNLLAKAIREEEENRRLNLITYGENEEDQEEDYIVLLNERDRERVGKALMTRMAQKKKEGLIDRLPILSETHAPIDGGLILRRGRIEINCSVKALFGELRPEWEGRVVAHLFPERKG